MNPNALPEYTVREVAQIRELSVVTFPADPNTRVTIVNPAVAA